MLTGVYILNNAKTFVLRNRNPAGNVGVSSATVAALTGVPVGGSIRLSHDSTAQAQMEMTGENVWAARYHLLGAEYVKSDGNGQPSLPNTITLHIDITSEGTLRKVDVNELIKLKVHDSPDNLEEPAKMVHGGDDSEDGTGANEYEDSPKYWTDLERAMKLFETALDPPEWKGHMGDEGEGEEDDDEDDTGD